MLHELHQSACNKHFAPTIPQPPTMSYTASRLILRIFFRKYLKFKKISTSQEAFISYCLSDSYYAQKYKAHILK